MLQFPTWKVALIVGLLLIGGLMALPNLFSDSFLGKEPRVPLSTDAAVVAEYEAELAAARESWWPGFLPSNKLNLGLDLQGGVYLSMEITESDVIANRLVFFQRDLVDQLNRARIFRDPPVRGEESLRITLKDASQMNEALRIARDANPTVPTTGFGSGPDIFTINQISPSTLEARVTSTALAELVKDAQRKSAEIVRRRIDPNGVSEISVIPSGNDRLILEAPGEPDSARIKGILERAGSMTFNLVNGSDIDLRNALSGRVPPGNRLLNDIETGQPLLVIDTPIVTGSDIASASQGFDPDDNSPAVNFRLSGQGAKRFGDATAQNRRRLFAIVLDDQIMSAPRINEPIYGGSVQITGSFTMQEANDLAAVIEAGELPAKLQFLEERTVGPQLGEDSIRAGAAASIIGLILVAVFMILAYGLLGGFAVGSLVANIILILGLLSGLGATLTLPGIAGIVLTIGMAVDANVLVFERIREEKRAGRSPVTAVQAGYERALSTIMDANITTFIAAAILYALGSGPVKGFAVTLAIGIVTSVFTAFVVTRWFTAMWLKAVRPKTLAV